MMNFQTCDAEQRAKRDDKDVDLKAVTDCYREGLIDKDEARSLMGFRDEETAKDDKPDDKPQDDRDEEEDDDSGDEGE